ncbi:hypothetical protein [Thalassoglobus sp.]|uniref:hypothetical protein n=1 Tax=Thalassoglobus sp. TaxID=2795869 RepID=UPI003AA964A8
MRKFVLCFSVIFICSATFSNGASASDSLDALGYKYPKHRFSLKNLRPHYDDGLKAVIPADQPVPRNWVVVGHRCTLLQVSSTTHQLLVQKLPTRPGSELTIWKCQPLPFGWAVLEEFTSNQFPGKNNALRIRKM